MTPMSSNRSAAGVTVFEGRIYVSGGHDGLQIFNSVRPWDPGQGSSTAPQDGAGRLRVPSLCHQILSLPHMTKKPEVEQK